MTINPMAAIRSENTRLRHENDQLHEEVNNLREFVAILNRLMHTASLVKDDAELLPALRHILQQALQLLNAPDGSLALLDNNTNQLVFIIVYGALSDQLTGYRLPADEGIAGWVVKHREPTLVRDVRRDQRFFADVDEAFKYRTQSILAAPLIGDNRVIGVVEALNQPGDEPFSEMDMELLNLMCRFAGEALANIERQGAS